MENFKFVTWNNKYVISDCGRLFVLKNGIFIQVNYQFSKAGYVEYYTKKGYTKYIHRLVAIHFIQNPNNYKEVNHIDANKQNNIVFNLEWCTRKENMEHASSLNLCRKPENFKVPTRQVICIQTQEIFESITQASISKNLKQESISKALKNKTRAGGFNWDYIELKEKDNEYIYIKSLK